MDRHKATKRGLPVWVLDECLIACVYLLCAWDSACHLVQHGATL